MTVRPTDRAALALLAAALLAGALGGLIGGLGGDALRTGRLDPLDWSLPALLGLALPALWLWWQRVNVGWVVVALLATAFTVPPLLLVWIAGMRFAWLPAAALVLLVLAALAMLGAGLAARRADKAQGRMSLLACLVAALCALALSALAQRPAAVAGEPVEVAILSALPLHGARSQGGGELAAPGGRSALDAVLLPAIRLRPIDALDAASLRGVSGLLLAQPRALAPDELAALDRWVRSGRRAVLLVDPDLLWESRYPLAHPLAPPRASLLGPLLEHWGLRLEAGTATGGDPVVRQSLTNGAMMQSATPGRLAAMRDRAGDAPCRLEQAGLVARCKLGAGRAIVVADVDWINPDLWTLSPQSPQDRRRWTADSPDLLAHWLTAATDPATPQGAGFLRDLPSLILALRIAALLAAALAGLTWIMIRAQLSRRRPANPMPAQRGDDTKQEQQKGEVTA